MINIEMIFLVGWILSTVVSWLILKYILLKKNECVKDGNYYLSYLVMVIFMFVWPQKVGWDYVFLLSMIFSIGTFEGILFLNKKCNSKDRLIFRIANYILISILHAIYFYTCDIYFGAMARDNPFSEEEIKYVRQAKSTTIELEDNNDTCIVESKIINISKWTMPVIIEESKVFATANNTWKFNSIHDIVAYMIKDIKGVSFTNLAWPIAIKQTFENNLKQKTSIILLVEKRKRRITVIIYQKK